MNYNLNRKVLWVDDDLSTLQLGRIILEQAGYSFLAAQDGEEGLALAQTERPDLMLLDYSLPGMSGKEVLETMISDQSPGCLRQIPVVMLTGRLGSNQERRDLMTLGLAAYLVKPFGPRELLNVIDNVVLSNEVREQNRLLEHELRETFTSVVRSLISLLSVKDPYTGEHSGMVLQLAERLARKCGLNEDQVFDVKIAALLHDIGKIGVPESILRKPARLTPEEKAEMDKHVFYGHRALAGIPKLQHVRELVYHHHERWDGLGYPDRLKGEQTPLGSRIVAVVDAYDAMTSDRPYRRGMRSEQALERLSEASGTQFDPLIVESFLECFKEGLRFTDRRTDLRALTGTFG
jgi:putative two-component system response regulator